MRIREHSCKRKTRRTITVVFSAPDPRHYSEITRSPSEEIEQIIVPAKSEMEDIKNELSSIYNTIINLPPLWVETFEYHRKRKNLSISDLSVRSHISETTLYNYKKKPYIQPKLAVVLAIIIGLNLHPIYAKDLLTKAGYNIMAPSPTNYIFQFLIECMHTETIEVWNQRLAEADIGIVLPGINNYAP